MPVSAVRRPLTSRLVGALLAVVAGAVSALVAVPAAQAAEATSGALSWGIRSNFRTYVGNQSTGTPAERRAAIGERVVPFAGATFDPAATPIPATTEDEVKRPYRFPVVGGQVSSATDLAIDLGGGVTYYYPDHTFQMSFSNLTLRVAGTVAALEADASMATVSGSAGSWVVGTPTVTADVVVAQGVAAVQANGTALSITGTGLTLTAAGAAALSGYLTAGSAMDDFALTATLSEAISDAATTPVAVTPPTCKASTVLVQGDVTIRGCAKVGQTLKASVGAWAKGRKATYQWTRNGKAIAGAKKPSYKLQPADVGKRIGVKVVAVKGKSKLARSSALPAKVAKGVLKAATPKIKGAATAGKTLTVATGMWTKGVKLTYQWYADGRKLSGKHGKTLAVSKVLRGKAITVRVTGKLKGYANTSKTSAAKRVTK